MQVYMGCKDVVCRETGVLGRRGAWGARGGGSIRYRVQGCKGIRGTRVQVCICAGAHGVQGYRRCRCVGVQVCRDAWGHRCMGCSGASSAAGA